MGLGGFRLALLLGVSAIGISLSAGAYAQDADLGEVVVRGGAPAKKKPADAKSDTPLATQTTAEQVRKREIGSISDLGNTTEPGVEYSKLTDGPAIRGLAGPRVVTVVDGIPIPYLENFARGSSQSVTNSNGGGSSFDFSSLSAADVVRGSDSSRIGSGAMGGAIVLRTLEPEDLLLEGRTLGGLTKLTYDSRDNSIGGSLAGAARAGATSVLLQGAYKVGHETDSKGNIDELYRARTEPNPLDYDQNNLLFKIRHDLERGHRIGLTAERYNRDAHSDMMTSWSVAPVASTYLPGEFFGNDETTRSRVSLDYKYEAPVPGGLVDSAFATGYWQGLEKHAGAEGIVRASRLPYLRDNQLDDSTFGLTGGAVGTVDGGYLQHRWAFGFDAAMSTAGSYVIVAPTTGSARTQSEFPDIDSTRLGFYVEDRVAFGDTGFSLTPGVRFDWHDYRPQQTDSYDVNPGAPKFPLKGHSGTGISPKLLATYEVSPQLEVFAQWSGSYRAPTVNELYLNFTNPIPGYAQVGNQDLKDETGHGFEIGAEFGDQDFGARVSAFHNWYRNFIIPTDLAPDPAHPELPFGVGSFANVEKVRIYGVELKGHKRFENGFIVNGGVSYVRGFNDETGEALDTVAPAKVLAGIGYERENWGVGLDTVIGGKYYGATAIKVEPYAIANASAWWEPTQVKGMRLQAGVKNIFDETYYDALGVRGVSASTKQPDPFYSQPGRSFQLSLTQKF